MLPGATAYTRGRPARTAERGASLGGRRVRLVGLGCVRGLAFELLAGLVARCLDIELGIELRLGDRVRDGRRLLIELGERRRRGLADLDGRADRQRSRLGGR